MCLIYLIIYRIPDSWPYSLNGYDFSFYHMTGENQELLVFSVTPYQDKNKSRSIDKVQNLEKEEGKYAKTLAKIQITAIKAIKWHFF